MKKKTKVGSSFTALALVCALVLGFGIAGLGSTDGGGDGSVGDGAGSGSTGSYGAGSYSAGAKYSSNAEPIVVATDNSAAAERYYYTAYDAQACPLFYSVRGKAVFSESESSILDEQGKYSAQDQSGILITTSSIQYGKRERASLSDENVKGWPKENPEVSVSFSTGKKYSGRFWNRSHLVAHMLGGEDAAQNLVTGTRAQNVGDNSSKAGMQYAEYLAYDYYDEHPDTTIKYLATAIYEADESIPRSVIVDMKSSDGGLDEEVEVFNVMPGYKSDYKTGEVSASGS